jgi:hypothetical protein
MKVWLEQLVYKITCPGTELQSDASETPNTDTKGFKGCPLPPIRKGAGMKGGDSWSVCFCESQGSIDVEGEVFKRSHIVNDLDKRDHVLVSAWDYMKLRCDRGIGTEAEEKLVRGSMRPVPEDRDFCDYVFCDPQDPASMARRARVISQYD